MKRVVRRTVGYWSGAVITRVVLFTWKPQFSDDEVDELLKDIRRLREEIPGEFELRCGKNLGGPPCGLDGSGGYTHVVVATFKDKETLDGYRAHPAHLAVVKKLDRMEDTFLLFQIES